MLLLAGCDGKAAEEFWQTMGMIAVGLVILGIMAAILQAILAICSLLYLVAELVVVVVNIAKPRPVSVVAGLLMGGLNVLSSLATMGAMALYEPPQSVVETPVPPDSDPQYMAFALGAVGVLSGAVLISSGIYGWMRLRKDVADPFVPS